MPVEIVPSTGADLDGIRNLLISAFRVPPSPELFPRRVLSWKYHAPVPGWDAGPRSFVLRHNGILEAHCAIWRFTLESPGEPLTGLVFLDWVSAGRMPGSGVLLMRQLTRHAALRVVAGGSTETRALMPRMGFNEVARTVVMARVLRPWGQFRTRPSAGLARDLARLGRATLGSIHPRPPATTVAAARVERFTSAFNAPGMPYRTPQFLNFWLASPAARTAGYILMREDRSVGHLLLARVGHQARILDLRISSTSAADWREAAVAALHAAASDPEAYEVAALTSSALVRQALAAAGFRGRGDAPLFTSAAPECRDIIPSWMYADDDTGYIHDPAHPYLF